MPQKPQVRAKEKRRLTRRLAKWRATNATQEQPQGSNAQGSSTEKKKAS